MTINIQGTGSLKKYVPSSERIEIAEGAKLEDLRVALHIGSQVKFGFNLNGKMVKSDHALTDKDRVILIMFVSAG